MMLRLLRPAVGREDLVGVARRLYCTHDDHALSLLAPTVGIWGANTGIGKTLVSAGLARAASVGQGAVCYVKPLQTGFPRDSDAALVAAACGSTTSVGPHAGALLPQSEAASQPTPEQWLARHGVRPGGVHASTLYAWSDAVGPHTAVEREGRAVGDEEVASSVLNLLQMHSRLAAAAGLSLGLSIVETAGGVCSPSASGRLQVDVWQGMLMPAVLVGDGRLGGVSATLSAYDSLIMRGYDVTAVVVLETEDLGNAKAFERHLRGGPGQRSPRVFTLPVCQPPNPASETEVPPGEVDAQLQAWLRDTQPHFDALHSHLQQVHASEVAWLASAPQRARSSIWWPFTQHRAVSDRTVTVFAGRHGEHFLVAKPAPDTAPVSSDPATPIGGAQAQGGADAALALSPRQPAAPAGQIERLYDACASWWTQGMNAELQPLLTRSLAYAAGRYTHVIFPENVHRPALELTEMLLDGPGRDWASRVFFSDDGSTAIEVALKMAFRKHAVDHAGEGAPPAGTLQRPRHVLALRNGYHGDTLGAMACSEESVFNAGQTPWYRAHGLFMDAPTCGLTKGIWEVRPPAGTCPATQNLQFASFEALFAAEREASPEAEHYRAVVQAAIVAHEDASGADIAACLMEPLLQGAGGMLCIDPLYQRVIISVCQERRIPVIADEVFTGLWRLGRISAMTMLDRTPDIACYAKLLTGGTVPMSVTLASEPVFHAFDGDTKAEALLHGHSYTAHPIGCQVGVASLTMLASEEFNQNIVPETSAPSGATTPRMLQDLWDAESVTALSHHDAVERVVALGTVLAVELKVAPGEGGYSSNVARSVTNEMRGHGVYARPLGNVVYLMCTPTSAPASLTALLDTLLACLGAAGGQADSTDVLP